MKERGAAIAEELVDLETTENEILERGEKLKKAPSHLDDEKTGLTDSSLELAKISNEIV